MEQKKKQYGLILKNPEEVQKKKIIASVFEDDDDELDKVDVAYQKTSASTIRVQNQAKRLQEEALAADPTIFNYDASYDEIQAEKNEKVAEQKKADKAKSSKYAENIINAHKRREIEKHSREERQQQKEREKEGELYADKETFITPSYRAQMEIVQEFRREEAVEARFNELTSVEKQRVWQAGLARNLLEDIARTGDSTGKKKERNLRKRVESRSPSPECEPSSAAAPSQKSDSRKDNKEKEKSKRSIYSDDEEGPQFNPPPKKNFEGDLKPGLNTVSKAQTNVERLRERQFTPTPPSSDDEGDRRRRDNKDNRSRRSRSRERREQREAKERQEAEEARKAAKEKEKKNKLKLRIVSEQDKAARLVRLKEILKQRNGPEQIEEFRRRYLERKESGIVVPPL